MIQYNTHVQELAQGPVFLVETQKIRIKPFPVGDSCMNGLAEWQNFRLFSQRRSCQFSSPCPASHYSRDPPAFPICRLFRGKHGCCEDIPGVKCMLQWHFELTTKGAGQDNFACSAFVARGTFSS